MRSNNSGKSGVRVSVLVLNHNGLRYIQETVSALLELDYPRLEILVFDNGSTDGSLAYLRKLESIRLIESVCNLGYSKGKNEAVRHATGDYVLMLDNDILIQQTDIISRLIASYHADTGFLQVPLLNAGAVKTRFYGIYYSFYGVNFHRQAVSITQIIEGLDDLIEIPAATGGCLFFKRLLWKELGGFDESQPFNLDDIDIGPRASLFGYRNYLYSPTYFMHLGVGHVDTVVAFAGRFKWQVSGHARSMLKNYNSWNLVVRFPVFWLFMWTKAFRYAIKYRSLLVLQKFFEGCWFFVENLPETLSMRRQLQRTRKVAKDRFLELQPPNFNANEC